MLKYGVQLTFPTTNNEVEYEGVRMGLRVGKVLKVKNLLLQSDSKLVVGHIKGEFKAKEERMEKYLKLTQLLTQEFEQVKFTHIPRSQNMGADELAKQASLAAGPTNTNLKIEVQKCTSIEEVFTFAIQSKSNWMIPIQSFLQERRLLQDVEEAKKVKKWLARFTILNDTLNKKGFSMPYLKCDNKEEAKYILEEVMKEFVETIQARDPWLAKSSEQVTFGLPCRRMQRSSSRDATNAKGLGTSNASY